MSEKENMPALNTDRELWREPPGDYFANSIHVTQSGAIGIDVGGTVIVMPLRAWHEAAKGIAAAEERGRRRGVELLRECDEALKTAMGTVECMSVFPPGHELAGRELLWHKLAVAVRAKIAVLAPRDSAPQPTPKMQPASSEQRAAELRRASPRARVDETEAPRDSAPAPGCLCQGGKTQPYCAYCLGMSSPRSSAPDSVTPSALPRDEGKEG